MARGQRQAADKQLGITNAAAAGAGVNAGADRAPLVAGYGGMIKNPGYDQSTKNAITGTAFGAANQAFDTADAAAGGRVARTRNDAGYLDSLDSLARSRAQTLSAAGAGTQKSFADEAIRQREAGLKGMGGLYGIDEDTMARLYGVGPSTLQARAAGTGGDKIAQGWIATAFGTPQPSAG